MTFDSNFVAQARAELADHVQPRGEFETAIVTALGEISWDEAVDAITTLELPLRRAAP